MRDQPTTTSDAEQRTGEPETRMASESRAASDSRAASESKTPSESMTPSESRTHADSKARAGTRELREAQRRPPIRAEGSTTTRSTPERVPLFNETAGRDLRERSNPRSGMPSW